MQQSYSGTCTAHPSNWIWRTRRQKEISNTFRHQKLTRKKRIAQPYSFEFVYVSARRCTLNDVKPASFFCSALTHMHNRPVGVCSQITCGALGRAYGHGVNVNMVALAYFLLFFSPPFIEFNQLNWTNQVLLNGSWSELVRAAEALTATTTTTFIVGKQYWLAGWTNWFDRFPRHICQFFPQTFL